MLLSDITLIAASTMTGIILTLIVLAAKHKSKIQTIVLSAIIVSAIISAVALLTVPRVVYIGPDETHRTYRAPFGYTDPRGTRHSLDITRCYVYNDTGDDAIVYPVTYGGKADNSFPVLLPTGELTEVPACPSRFYERPADSVQSQLSSKTIWHLDTPQKMIERRSAPVSTTGQ